MCIDITGWRDRNNRKAATTANSNASAERRIQYYSISNRPVTRVVQVATPTPSGSGIGDVSYVERLHWGYIDFNFVVEAL